MKTKTDKPKTTARDENEDRFYRFAKALIAVPKKELDKELRAGNNAKKTTSKKT